MKVDGAMRTDIQQVLQQMRAMRTQTQAPGIGPGGAGPLNAPRADGISGPASPGQVAKPVPSFGTMLHSAIASVNELQQDSSAQAASFARGDTDDLVRVMIASQKASVGFQALSQVRNRMVTAYQEIMNMPI